MAVRHENSVDIEGYVGGAELKRQFGNTDVR